MPRFEPLTSQPKRSLLSLAVPVAALVLGACVFGFRGEVEFADEASLAGVETVQLQLPPTQLVVTGDSARTFIDWQGSWVSIGGSGGDALASARKAELSWESWEQVGRLSATLPVEVRDITVLDYLDVQTASDVAHEIVGTGEVFVSGINAYISVELDGGSVEILGGTEQLRIVTARGDVTLSTAATVNVDSGLGTVTVNAEASRDIDIRTTGSVFIKLAEVSNIDIDIAEAGEILVDLDTAAHVGAGSYRRAIGSASSLVKVRSGGGRVELATLAVAEPADPAP